MNLYINVAYILYQVEGSLNKFTNINYIFIIRHTTHIRSPLLVQLTLIKNMEVTKPNEYNK
jgi:hypothetical protein